MPKRTMFNLITTCPHKSCSNIDQKHRKRKVSSLRIPVNRWAASRQRTKIYQAIDAGMIDALKATTVDRGERGRVYLPQGSAAYSFGVRHVLVLGQHSVLFPKSFFGHARSSSGSHSAKAQGKEPSNRREGVSTAAAAARKRAHLNQAPL